MYILNTFITSVTGSLFEYMQQVKMNAQKSKGTENMTNSERLVSTIKIYAILQMGWNQVSGGVSIPDKTEMKPLAKHQQLENFHSIDSVQLLQNIHNI